MAELAARESAAAEEGAAVEAAKAAHGERIAKWGREPGGAPKNIRNLLCSMHTVLWEGSKWEPLSMAKIVVAGKVRAFYLRAVTVVHPDKASGLGAEKAYIAKCIFTQLEESYKLFCFEEMGGPDPKAL